MKKYSFLFMLFISFLSFAQTAKKVNKKSRSKTPTMKPQKLPANTSVWIIDAERASCEGVITMQCLLVKKQGQKEFELFYDNIIGFDYQEGFIYTIWVKEELKTPPIPADASMYNYKLVKVVTKKSKTVNQTKPEITKPLSGLNVSMTKILTINETKGQCEGNPNAQCLLIKEQEKKEFEIFYQPIDGFTFEEGYRQTIQVNERYVANPMIKQTDPIYTLVKVLKKELIFTPEKSPISTIETPKTPLDKKWILRKIKESDTSSFEIDDDGVFLEIKSAESKVNGKAPCNTYFGGLKSDFISTFQVITFTTRMYCENMKFEDLYLAKLQSANRYEIKNKKLNLFKDDKLVLIFE